MSNQNKCARFFGGKETILSAFHQVCIVFSKVFRMFSIGIHASQVPIRSRSSSRYWCCTDAQLAVAVACWLAFFIQVPIRKRNIGIVSSSGCTPLSYRIGVHTIVRHSREKLLGLRTTSEMCLFRAYIRVRGRIFWEETKQFMIR
jgi:hypothetical protein